MWIECTFNAHWVPSADTPLIKFFDVSTFGDRCVDLRRSMCRPSEIDVSTFGDRCRLSEIDVSTFGDRCVDLRRSVSTFGDRCVDLRRSMCRPSKIEIDVKLRCYTLAQNIDTIRSCMRIASRVRTSVLSFNPVSKLYTLHFTRSSSS